VYSLVYWQFADATFHFVVEAYTYLGFKIKKSGEREGQALGFTSTTTPASRIIFGQPLVHFTAVMWWSTVTSIPHAKIRTERYIFQYYALVC
jgi:hypothetical protein